MTGSGPQRETRDPAAAWEGVASALLIYGAAYLIAAVAAPRLLGDASGRPDDGLYRSVFVLIAGCIGGALLVAAAARRPAIRAIFSIDAAPAKRPRRWSAAVHLPLIVAYQIGVWAVRRAVTGAAEDPMIARLLDTAPTVFLPLFAIGVVGPMYEEFFWRGLVQGALLRVFGSALPAVLLTSALFAASHIGYPPLQQFYMLCFGAYLGLIRHASRSLYVPICLHVAWNLLLFVPAL